MRSLVSLGNHGFGRFFLRLHRFAEAEAFPVHLEDVAAMGEAVQQRRGHAFALEHLAPIGEGQVAGDQQAGPLVTIGEHLEEQLRAGAAEGQVSEFIADEQVGLVQLGQETIELVRLLGFLQSRDQIRGSEEAHALTQATGGQTQRDGQVGLARSHAADEAAIGVLVDPFAAGQFQDLLLVQRRR